MNSHRTHVHPHHHQRLLWFFSFCNQRKSSSSSSSGSGSFTKRSTRRKFTTNRNKFAQKYQQQLLQQSKLTSNIFGRDLTEHTQLYNDEDSVPNIVKTCTNFIEKQGIIFGIYRLSGMRVNITKLRQEFDKNTRITMIDSESISNDAHAVACVLKQYFRELPTPLLTFHMYEKFIELFKHSNLLQDENDQDELDGTISSTNQQDKRYDAKQATNNKNDLTSVTNESKLSHDCELNARNNDQLDASSSAINSTGKTKVSSTSDNLNHGDDDNVDENDATKTTTIQQHQQQTKSPSSSSSASLIASKTIDLSRFPITTTQPKSYLDSKINLSAARYRQASASTLRQDKASKATSSPTTDQFTTSASDSQLISLSSVLATTPSDVKYQVRLDELRKLLLRLPRAHYQTLKYLMRHLAFMASKGDTTGMDSKNVAIVWAPNLLKPPELSARMETLQVIGLQAVITEQLIKHHQFLFDNNQLDEPNEISSS